MNILYEHDLVEVGILQPGEVFYHMGQYYLRIVPTRKQDGPEMIAVTLTAGNPHAFPRNQLVTHLPDACLANYRGATNHETPPDNAA